MQINYQAFQEAGVEVVAVVVAPLASVESWCQSSGIGYPILADSEHQVSEQYGVYNLLGNNLAAPAVFVIASDGRIVYRFIGVHSGDMVSAQTLLANLP